MVNRYIISSACITPFQKQAVNYIFTGEKHAAYLAEESRLQK